MEMKRPPVPRIAFLTGKGGGDFIALQRARARGLVDFETVAFITTSPASNALTAYREHPESAGPLVVENMRSDREKAFDRIAASLSAARPDYIFLCGFTYLLPAGLVQAFKDRIINTHHAALPDHPGLFTKEQLVAKGEPELAATVHLVDEGVDTGRILFAARFPNFGADAFGKILRYYRFVQDVLIVQTLRSLTGSSGTERMVDFHDIRFFSSAEIRIIDEIKGDYDFD